MKLLQWQDISTTSSPVYDFGFLKIDTRTLSINESESLMYLIEFYLIGFVLRRFCQKSKISYQQFEYSGPKPLLQKWHLNQMGLLML